MQTAPFIIFVSISLIGSITGIVLGSIALKQIKRTPQGRRGMAIAGIAIGVGPLVAYLIITIVGIIVAK
jgi:peptidyl-prolyl cis-trans isomerase B (cyclophilin B)